MKKIWLEHYPNNVASKISELNFESIIDLVDHASEKYSKQVAFHNLNSNMSYSETSKYSKRFSSYLRNELNISKESNIAIMLPNLLSFPISFLGSLRTGAKVINLNPLLTSRELRDILVDSQADTIIVLDRFLNVLEQILTDTKIKNVIVCRPYDLLSIVMKPIVKMILFLKKQTRNHNKKYILFTELINYTKESLEVTIKRDDIALLQYTGGTTGGSKAALLSHKNLVANVQQLESWVDSIICEGEEVVITALPLYHIFSLTVNFLYFFKIGAKNILITNPRDIKNFIKVLEKNRFTVITAVNTLFNLLLTSSKFKKINFNSLKFSVGGGMAVLESTSKKWKKFTGCEITQGYGLTETSPIVTVNPVDEGFNGSIGLPLPSTDISIRDEEDKELDINEPGELCVKGPQVMTSYWNKPEETKNAFTKDGYFKTGDIAKIRDNGYIEIVDRKKDMIISSGFNVYPNEIEEYVSNYEGVHECGVVGKPDSNRGEMIILYVVKDKENLSESDIAEFCKKGLTIYKQPKKIIFIDEIPKNNVGKILRRKLRDL